MSIDWHKILSCTHGILPGFHKNGQKLKFFIVTNVEPCGNKDGSTMFREATVDITHFVPFYLIPFEEDASDFLIFWSTHMSKIWKRKKSKSYDANQCGCPGPQEQILAESAALAICLSPKAIMEFNFFLFPHF